MFFTQEDYKKIQHWLALNSKKDTEFNEALTPLSGDETIAFVQKGYNVKASLKDFLEQLTLLGVPDFLNVTEKYNGRNISLNEAIQLVPFKIRKIGQVITFLDEEGKWQIYQFRGEVVNQWNTTSLWVNLIQEFIGVNIIADEEDLTSTIKNNKSVLKFRDKPYNEDDFSGLGRIYLRKNITEVTDHLTKKSIRTNLLAQSMLGKDNTIYIIQYDYNLNGQTLTIPENSTLDFKNGGNFSNGTINCVNTTIRIDDFDSLEVTLIGTYKVVSALNGDKSPYMNDTEYNSVEHSGLGHVYLRKNKGILTQDNFTKSNTVYHIRYDYDLQGEEITIPEECVLKFDGGSFENGSIIFDNTTIDGDPIINCFIYGSLKNKIINADWFIKNNDNILLYLCKFKNLTINLPPREINIHSTLAINDGVKLIGNETVLNLGDNCITNLFSNTDYPEGALYYKPFTNSKQIRIIADAGINSKSIQVENATHFNIGDHIQIKNGYCDMFRVMEQYTGSKFDWNNDDTKLWEAEINKIDNIDGNTLYLSSPLSIEILSTPKTYNFFNDENQLNDYTGYNIPTIQKIGVNNNIQLLNINIKSTNQEQAILFNGVNYCIIRNCKITNLNSNAIILSTCLNCVISQCDIYSKKYSIQLENVCYNNIIKQNNCNSQGDTDSVILLMGNCYSNTITDNAIRANTPFYNAGLYINTSKENFICNTSVYNAGNAVLVGFCFGKNIINGINAINCRSLLAYSYSRHDIVTNGILISNINPSNSAYYDMGLTVVDSADITISNFNIMFPKVDSEKEGRIHIYKSVGVVMDNIKVEGCYINYSTNIDTEKYNNLDRFTLKNSNVGRVILVGTTTYLKLHKKDSIINTKINDGLFLRKVYNSNFINCDIKGGIALNLQEGSLYNDFIECTFSGDVYDIKFGEENVRNQLTSLQYFNKCYYSKVIGYDNNALSTVISGSVPAFKVGQKVSILSTSANTSHYYDSFSLICRERKWYIENRIPSYNSTDLEGELGQHNKGTLLILDNILKYFDGQWKTITLEN